MMTGNRCGTYSGYRVHLRLKEQTCTDCRAANREHNRPFKPSAASRAKAQVSNKQWVKSNPDRVKAIQKKYDDSHVEARRLKSKRWREKNLEHVTAYRQSWWKSNPDKQRTYNHRRRAHRLGNGHEPYTEAEILELYGTNCYLCGEPIDLKASRKVGSKGWKRSLHIDHLIPLSKGGPDTLVNVRPTHGICNSLKHDTIVGVHQGRLEEARMAKTTMLDIAQKVDTEGLMYFLSDYAEMLDEVDNMPEELGRLFNECREAVSMFENLEEKIAEYLEEE